jgi:multiple sugar transport system ATP-binding protein
VSIRTDPEERFEPDEKVAISIVPGAAHFFSSSDGRRLAA